MARNAQRRKLLGLEDLYHPERKLDLEGKPRNEWVWLDSECYVGRPARKDAPDKTWWRGSPGSAEIETVFDADRMREALEACLPTPETDDVPGLSVGAVDGAGSAALVVFGGGLYRYEHGNNSAIRIADAIDIDVGARFSPDFRWISYVHHNNLYIAEPAGGTGRPLTREGSDTVLAGRLDWVYQEEIYGRDNFEGYWWSPDSTRIAFLQLEVSRVREHTLPAFGTDRSGGDTYRYPRAGTPNPAARLGVIDVPNGTLRWIALEGSEDGGLLIVNVAWAPGGGTLSFQVQDREQTWLELRFADPGTGKAQRVLRETSEAWVRMPGRPHWMEDGSFVWISDRTGWSHLYRYAPDGQPIAPITSGDWDVREVYGTAGTAVFFAANERSPLSLDTYRADVDGGLERLTAAEGTHRSVFSFDMAHFIDAWSSVTAPSEVRLHRADGSAVRTLEESTAPAAAGFDLGRAEHHQLPTRDGDRLEALMIKPPDFDPNRKYPVLCHVYGGPMTPLVRNVWGGQTYLWHQMIASRGAVVWIVDPRSASACGVRSAYPVYRNFGALELEDLEDSIRWLEGQRYIDTERVGIWGWSYGGYLTAYAMTHSRLFRLGIAGAPVTDWRLYDTIYTERYMRTPEHNPDGYRRSSVVEAASNLHGKLLIVHGTEDDNVHLDHSMRLVRALQGAGKDFELMLYPGARHAIDDPGQLYDLRRRMTDYILENL